MRGFDFSSSRWLREGQDLAWHRGRIGVVGVKRGRCHCGRGARWHHSKSWQKHNWSGFNRRHFCYIIRDGSSGGESSEYRQSVSFGVRIGWDVRGVEARSFSNAGNFLASSSDERSRLAVCHAEINKMHPHRIHSLIVALELIVLWDRHIIWLDNMGLTVVVQFSWNQMIRHDWPEQRIQDGIFLVLATSLSLGFTANATWIV